MDDVAVMMRIDSHRDGRGMTKTVDITWEDPTSGFLSATTHYELAPTLCRGRDERAGSPRVTILECIVPNTLTVEVVRDQSPKRCIRRQLGFATARQARATGFRLRRLQSTSRRFRVMWPSWPPDQPLVTRSDQWLSCLSPQYTQLRSFPTRDAARRHTDSI